MVNSQESRIALRQASLDMMELCKKQFVKSKISFINHDTDLAEEVMHTERRVNALDLKIDAQCEQYLALFTPVAVDLRFILALRKINFNLEIIADHAYAIAKYVVELDTPTNTQLLEKLNFEEMYATTFSMIEDIIVAFEEKNTKRARKVFKKDRVLDKINKQAYGIVIESIKNDPNLIEHVMLSTSVIKKMEHIGDLTENIAQEIIFYLEAEVIKHQKKKWKD